MARLPRQAKSAAKPIIDDDESSEDDEYVAEKEPKPSTGDFFKDIKREAREDSLDSISDFEEGSKKRKGTSSTTRSPPSKKIKLSMPRKRQASPVIPPMSEDEYEDDREDDIPLFEKAKKPLPRVFINSGIRVTSLATTLRIEVLHAPTAININLSDFITPPARQEVMSESLDGSTLLGDSRMGLNDELTKNTRASTPKSFVEMRANPKYACFLELEPDLRNRIYREMLVKETPVEFNPSPDLSRTAALLRTCRQVHNEATGILYGENAFHLDRTEHRRGTLFIPWREVGYKDMRRFLETIGQDNLAKMRFLSMSLSDGAPIWTPELTPEQRRYHNDPVLQYIFRLIGKSGAVFEKLVVDFGGRGSVDLGDVAFIRAFTSMKCHKLINTCFWHHSRIGTQLLKKMQDFMTVPTADNVDSDRQKAPKMKHEMVVRSYNCTTWRCFNR